jgi:non-heme chloroperoxidase
MRALLREEIRVPSRRCADLYLYEYGLIGSTLSTPLLSKELYIPVITTKDGVEIYYKDWGTGQPIVFSHGWPLSADDWDNQMLFFLQQGYRVIAHDRRGHGRSTQTGDGHDMDHYADDLLALVEHLDLKDAIHVGHSTGGGEVTRYLARHGERRAAKAALISAVTPYMLKTEANPLGLPKSVFDGLQAQLAANRSEFYRDLPAGPFYGFNRPGVKSSEAVIANWWRQGMMGLHGRPEEDHRAGVGDA